MLKSLDRKAYGEYSDLEKGMWAENMEDKQEVWARSTSLKQHTEDLGL